VKSGVDHDFFDLREALEILAVQSVDLCLSLLQGRARLQASDVIPVVAVMNGLLFGSEGERHPQANVRVNKSKFGSHHADDFEGPAADAQFSAKGRFVSGVQTAAKARG